MHTQLTELTTPALLPCWRRAVNPLASVPIAILKVIVIMLLLDRFMPHTAPAKQTLQLLLEVEWCRDFAKALLLRRSWCCVRLPLVPFPLLPVGRCLLPARITQRIPLLYCRMLVRSNKCQPAAPNNGTSAACTLSAAVHDAPCHLKLGPLVLPLNLGFVVGVKLGGRSIKHSVVKIELVFAWAKALVVVELLPSAQARSQRRRREGQMFSARQSGARSAKQHAPPSVQHVWTYAQAAHTERSKAFRSRPQWRPTSMRCEVLGTRHEMRSPNESLGV
jgi:hypothetical protein